MKEFIKNAVVLTLFFLLMSALWGEDLVAGKNPYKDFEILTVSPKTITITYTDGAAELEIKDLPGVWKQYLLDHKGEFKVKPDYIKDIKEHKEVNDGATYAPPPKPKLAPEEPNDQIIDLIKNKELLENETRSLKEKYASSSDSLGREEILFNIQKKRWFLSVVNKRIAIRINP